MFRLAEDDCRAAESAAPRSWQSGLDLHLRLRRLQPGAHAQLGGRSSSGVSRGRRVPGEAGIGGEGCGTNTPPPPRNPLSLKYGKGNTVSVNFQQPAKPSVWLMRWLPTSSVTVV